MLNQSTLVLESVTLAELIELVVKVLVDLSRSPVLDQQSSEDAETSHPENLRRHTRICSTLALTVAGVATTTLSNLEGAGPGSRVHDIGLLNDQAVRDELANGLA